MLVHLRAKTVKRIVFCCERTVKVTLAKGQTRGNTGTQSFRSKGMHAYDSGAAGQPLARSSVDLSVMLSEI
jgi:hypothetical protein